MGTEPLCPIPPDPPTDRNFIWARVLFDADGSIAMSQAQSETCGRVVLLFPYMQTKGVGQANKNTQLSHNQNLVAKDFAKHPWFFESIEIIESHIRAM